ncbi:MAG: amino acid adenylation domain-containing protein [Alphaproteobacteria bacterium]|nr:amino acid adenylation domain-containing protein [Alphaproteobacteria bacterium]
MFAILKAGGAYVPIDPAYPDDRIEYIVEDTKSKIILTNEHYKERMNLCITKGINESLVPIFALEEIDDKLSEYSTSNLPIRESLNHLCYVIYTSGTTGKPKGVMVEHYSYNILIESIKKLLPKTSIRTYSTTSYVFDIFGLEYGLSLLSGGCITLGNINFTYLDCGEFDFIQMTPSFCELVVDNLFNVSNTIFFIGGEALNINLLNKLHSRGCNLFNFYGPTETTIWSSAKCYMVGKKCSSVSLGKGLDNYKLYVLDRLLRPLPIGAIGELYIGGDGVARGYLGRSELTAERFVANPFRKFNEIGKGKNSRLYKTGDLVRLSSSGEIEYIGRNDFQVKIRGYRIELGEIESVLLSYSGVKQCVVVSRILDEDGNKDLVAYYISEEILSEEELRNYLYNTLPDYRAEVLNIDEQTISITDDFFRLGGNSIIAIRLVSKLNKIFLRINISAIFQHSTIEKFTLYLQDKDGQNDIAIISKIDVKKHEEQSLSFAQERVWFIERYEGGTHAYNIPLVFKLKDLVDIGILERSIGEIVRRHEVLRTVICEDGEGRGYQEVLDHDTHPILLRIKEARNIQLELTYIMFLNLKIDI